MSTFSIPPLDSSIILDANRQACLQGASCLPLVFRKHFSLFRYYVDRERKVAFVLNPKVGTTFIRKCLVDAFAKFYSQADASNGRYRLLNSARKMPIAPLADYFDFLRNPDGYKIYSIVRNPYKRLVSGWRDKFYDGHFASESHSVSGYPRSIRKGVLAELRAFAKARNLPGGEKDTLVAFSTFVEFIASGVHGKRNHHWDRQSDVIFYSDIPYTQTFQMEKGLDRALYPLFKDTEVTENWILQRAGLPSNASSIDKESPITSVLADRIYEIFEDDFVSFGYAKEDW